MLDTGIDYGTGGWTCHNCGMYVGHGITHVCVVPQQPYPYYTLPAYSETNVEETEIIEKLNEIIRLLKAMK